jgi:folate-binding protein YgfZ
MATDTPTIAHYGNPLEEYRAVREASALFDISNWGRLRIVGRDRVRYLHNMVSNDIRNLKAGSGCHAVLLTHQGKMESDLHIFALEESLLVECPPGGFERARTTLARFIVSEDVRVEDLTEEYHLYSLQGPGAREAAARFFGDGVSRLAPLQWLRPEKPDGSMVTRRDRTGCDGYDLWIPASQAESCRRSLLDAGNIRPAGAQALEWLRTEAGIPWYGVDMDERNLPLEFGLMTAISLNKGCYRGQEIVARIHYRGKLDRSLGALKVEHDTPPARGAAVLAGDQKAGEVTSATWSPRLERPLALCILKSDYLVPGTRLEVAFDQRSYPAEVVSVPLKD